jgi:NAD(P)-dependent dehydrogenase (short-subunit alcohol dehydrogenase family)
MTGQGAVVIAGASTGIGRATARYLAERGFRVFAGVRRDQDAEVLRQEGAGRVTPLRHVGPEPDDRFERRARRRPHCRPTDGEQRGGQGEHPGDGHLLPVPGRVKENCRRP